MNETKIYLLSISNFKLNFFPEFIFSQNLRAHNWTNIFLNTLYRVIIPRMLIWFVMVTVESKFCLQILNYMLCPSANWLRYEPKNFQKKKTLQTTFRGILFEWMSCFQLIYIIYIIIMQMSVCVCVCLSVCVCETFRRVG